MELNITDILAQFDIWHWWIGAVAFGVLEMLAPGVLFLWLAIAAIIVGFLKLAMPELPWEEQWIAFAVLSVLSAIVGRLVYKRSPEGGLDHPRLNQRSAQYIGRNLTLLEAVSNHTSRAMVDDTTWAVRSAESLPKGAQVVVKDVDGIILIVEPLPPAPQLHETDQAQESA